MFRLILIPVICFMGINISCNKYCLEDDSLNLRFPPKKRISYERLRFPPMERINYRRERFFIKKPFPSIKDLKRKRRITYKIKEKK